MQPVSWGTLDLNDDVLGIFDADDAYEVSAWVQMMPPHVRAGGMTHDTTTHDRQDITPEEIRAAIVAGMAEFARQGGVTLVLDGKQIAESTARQFARHTRLTSLIMDSAI